MDPGPRKATFRLLERSSNGAIISEFGSSWTGKIIKVPRNKTSLDALKKEKGVDSPGLYILSSKEKSSTDLPDVYIGETDDLLGRIKQHDRGKEFWDVGFGVVSKSHDFDNELNRTNCKFLESTAISKARSIGRSNVLNKTNPPVPRLDIVAEEEMKSFYNRLTQTLPLLGCHILTPNEPGNDDYTSRPTFGTPPDPPLQPTQHRSLQASEEMESKNKVIQLLGLVEEGNKGKFKWYRAPNGDIIHLKFSNYYERHKYYWYGTTPKSLENAEEFNITKFCFIQGDEGFMMIDIETLKTYVSSAKTSEYKSTGEVRHYHTFIRIYPEEILFHYADAGETFPMKDYFTPL